jgi:anti-anti-sigma factor
LSLGPQVKRDLQQEVFMTGTMYFEDVMRRVETSRACELTELVRGCDRHLIEEMTPIVRRESVALNMTSVERIDAAGIAALISLYRIAKESGNSFSVSNAAPHVAELLALVGLDGILLSHNVNQSSHSDSPLAQNAA